MTVVVGMGAPGVFHNVTTYNLLKEGRLKGSFQCSSCERDYCWDCSDSERSCKCGRQAWTERMYLEGGARAGMTLVITVAYFVATAYFVSARQIAVPENLRVVGFFLLWLIPALVLFRAARDALRVSAAVAAALALGALGVIAWLWF